MKTLFLVYTQLFICTLLSGQVKEPMQIQKGFLSAKTPKLSKWKILPRKQVNVPTRDANGLVFGRDIKKIAFKEYGTQYYGLDPLIQSSMNAGLNISSSAVKIENNIEGIGFSNIAPADPSIAIGTDHIIQMVNGKDGSAYYRIYQKNNGNILTEGFMDEIPGASYNGAGDCITWYDQFEDRYVMTEFGDSSVAGFNVNTLIIAVSATANPLGEWYIYEFFNQDFFPDYPKYGNSNQAWFGMTRDFNNQYLGSSVWAFDKFAMIKGESTVTAIRYRYTDTDNKFNSLSPVSMDGLQLNKISYPGIFMYYSDDNLTQDPNDADSLGLIAMEPNFNNPSNSSTYFLKSFVVAPFRSNFCQSKSCIPSLSGEGYDAISNRIMNKPYLRKIGNNELIVCNHTVDATGNNEAGLRWYELQFQNNNWTLKQQSTYAPQFSTICNKKITTHRFMGSIAINNSGQIALGYNSGNSNGYASIGFTGRNETDQQGILTYEETIGKSGEGYGTFKSRWGDYNDISTDLNNDSLFWFTAMYDSPNGWSTKIISFKLTDLPELDAKLVSINQPNECLFICDTTFTPNITIQNNGRTEINQLEIFIELNGNTIQKYKWTGNLKITEQLNLDLPKLITPEEKLQLKIFINSVNGINDLNNSNDSIFLNIKNTSGSSLPILEEFENENYLLNGWSKFSNGSPVFNWIQTGNAYKNGTRSMFVNNFNINQPGKFADLKMPFINLKGLDSIKLNFWIAAAIYDKISVDTLEILISDDCDSNYTSIWKKWGNEIITRPGEVNNSFIPNSNEWKYFSIDLNQYKGKRGIYIIFRNINGYGNNIYIDDIAVNGKKIVNNNASLKQIKSPDIFSCDKKVNPIVLFENEGNNAIEMISLKYKTDETEWMTFTKKTMIASYKNEYINIPEIPVSPGQRILTIAIDKINGYDDEKKDADTIVQKLLIKSPINLPFTETIKSAVIPIEWNLKNESQNIQWNISNISSDKSPYSFNLKNISTNIQPENAYLITPWFHFIKNDSVILSYDFAFRKNQNFADLSKDTIKIMISKNCDSNFIKVYEASGINLLTGFLPSGYTDFKPNDNEWKNQRIDLTEFVKNTEDFIIKIDCNINRSSNLFLDNFNVFTSKIPDLLKENGYLIRPNPFLNEFRIDLFPDAEKLNKIEIYNSTGQLIFFSDKTQQRFKNIVEINVPQIANGIYFLRLLFTDKIVTKRLIKSN